jgi:hypothetical protein
MPIDLLAQSNNATRAPVDLLAARSPQEDTPVEGLGGSAVTSASAGFNQGVENVTLGTVQLASRIADKVLGTDMTAHVGKVKATLEKAQEAYKNSNPMTFALGKGVGSIAATAPTLLIPGAGEANIIKLGSQGLAQGAIAGALMYTDDGSITSHLGNAVIGGVIGGTVGGAVGAIQGTVKGAMSLAATYMRGVNSGKDAAKTFVDDVTTGIGAKLNPSNPDVTAKNVLDAVEHSYQKVKVVKEANYTARNNAADKSGLEVVTNNVNDTIENIQKELGVRPNADDTALLKIINTYGGDEPISLSQSYSLLKKAGDAAYTAGKTDTTKARFLGQIKQAIEMDVDKAVTTSGNQSVQQLHNNATNFYKETYMPIKEVARSKAVEKLTEDAWVSKLVKDSASYSQPNAGLDKLGGDIKNQLAGAHMNAVKSSLTDPISGQIDFHDYISALNKDLLKNPSFKHMANEIGNLSKVVDVVKSATRDRGQGLTNLFTVSATTVGSPIAGAITWLTGQTPKVGAMYALGKMTSDPVIKSLLAASKNIDSVSTPIKEALLTRILGYVGSIVNSKTMMSLNKAASMGGMLAVTPSNSGVNRVQSVTNRNPGEAVTLGGIRG